MRKAVGGLLLLLCVCICAGSAFAETGTVTASALVLREGPGTEYAMLLEIPGGARLELLGYQNGWYQVRYDGQEGYVSGRYVRVDLPDALPQAEATAESGIVRPDLSLPALAFDGENNPNYPRVLKPGDTGNSVIDLQVTLQHMGYSVTADGQFGYDTQAAVMKLQLAMGLDTDGIVGNQTRKMIGNSNPGGVELLDWWLGGNVAYARLTEATLYDVRTGIRFRVSRYGGDSHCDVEPLKASDTKTFLSILGGEWTWDRRPVFLEVNGRVIAGSINCMPHEGQHIMDNDFDGHFCLHLLGSRTHETDRVDEQHAACVQEAWESRARYRP